MHNIQMVDLKSQYHPIKEEIDKGIQDVLDSTQFIRGSKVSEFAVHLQNYLGVRHVIPVANGTDALQIALMSLDLQPGDEVITPAFTFIATAEVIKLLQLTPVFADVNENTFNIDVASLHQLITPRTKAIIPVHLFGQNADMEALLQFAKQHQLYVIEDACQSIGSQYTFSNGEQKMSGCMGHIGCTSFFPSKNLGCFGDGGAIFTDNEMLAAKMTAIANHGMVVRYYHDYVGVNSRLDSLQAAVLDVKLKYLDKYTEARQIAAAAYDEAFSGLPELIVPHRSKHSTHVFHQYTLRLKGVDRTQLMQSLQSKGIPTMIYYPVPLHRQKVFQNEVFSTKSLPVSEKLSEEVLSLPMHTELTNEQLKYITSSVLSHL